MILPKLRRAICILSTGLPTETVDNFFSVVSSMKKILQDIFLRHLMDNCTVVYVFLMNGIKLQGCIKNFDEHVVIIKRQDAKKEQLVFKQVISTIVLLPQTHG